MSMNLAPAVKCELGMIARNNITDDKYRLWRYKEVGPWDTLQSGNYLENSI